VLRFDTVPGHGFPLSWMTIRVQRFAPYLFDRLLDAAPDSRNEAAQPTLSIEQLKDTVARDVEALLNTRCAVSGNGRLDGLTHVRRSIVRFGLDDFSSRSLASTTDRDFICRAIERAIADHEPRLRNTRVTIDAHGGAGEGLRFAIHALLQVHPATEPVSFDAVLQTGTHHYRVASSGRVAAAQR
jgi:type VI secretion system protein ImpF